MRFINKFFIFIIIIVIIYIVYCFRLELGFGPEMLLFWTHSTVSWDMTVLN